MNRLTPTLVFLSALLANLSCERSTGNADLDLAQGTWICESMQAASVGIGKDREVGKLVIKGTTFTIERPDRRDTDTGRVSVDSTTNPKQARFYFDRDNGAARFALYELSGDRLRICMFEDSYLHSPPPEFRVYRVGQRPTSRPTDPPNGDPTVIYTFKRGQ